MASLNKVMIIGNLTRDPELRYTPKGQAVTDIALAVNRRYVVDGEKREEVTYVDVTFWGKGAEIIAQYMKKGNPMYVEGRLRLDSWDDKTTGQKRSRLTVTGEEFQFLGGKGEGGGSSSGGSQHYDDEGSSSRSSGGNSSPRPQPQQRSGGYSSGSSGGGNSGPSSPPPSRPDAFPPGLDDDEIPF